MDNEAERGIMIHSNVTTFIDYGREMIVRGVFSPTEEGIVEFTTLSEEPLTEKHVHIVAICPTGFENHGFPTLEVEEITSPDPRLTKKVRGHNYPFWHKGK